MNGSDPICACSMGVIIPRSHNCNSTRTNFRKQRLLGPLMALNSRVSGFVACLLLFVSTTPLSDAKQSLDQPLDGINSGKELKELIEARCNEDGFALWAYEGVLVDPLEGRKIADVEGLELVRFMTSFGDSRNPETKRRCKNELGDLEVGPLLAHPNATFNEASTILSRKLFCYKAPNNPRQLLKTIKLRPNAPMRRIPTKQSVAVYETATTFIDRGKELIAHTEWPDRQSIWGRATRNFHRREQEGDDNSEKNSGSKTFDFTIYARQKSANKKREQLFDLTKPPAEPDASETVSSPKRAKLIEFGTSSSSGRDKFGARESYSYTMQSVSSEGGLLKRLGLQGGSRTNTPPICTVRYSRYGEAPPFFGPGRLCSLELQGRRISSLDDLPPLTASLIAERMSPQFLSYQNQTVTPGKALAMFRSPHASALHVRPADDEPSDFWLPDYLKDHSQVLWNKIQCNIPKFKRKQPSTNWADKVKVPP